MNAALARRVAGGGHAPNFGGLGYQINESMTAYAGYRYPTVHHQDAGFLYDASQQGPMSGLGIRFQA